MNDVRVDRDMTTTHIMGSAGTVNVCELETGATVLSHDDSRIVP